MVPVPGTGSNVRSVDMQFTQVAYGGCWKCPHAWQRCSASTPCLAASQKGCVHAFGTGMGLVTLLQSFIVMVFYLPSLLAASLSQSGISHALFPSGQVGNDSVKSTPTAACPSAARALPGVCRARKRERRQLGRRQARCTVTPFPTWTALPPSEYYEVIRLPHGPSTPLRRALLFESQRERQREQNPADPTQKEPEHVLAVQAESRE